MVSFRRFVLALAVLALFAGMASAQVGAASGSAGGPFTCTAFAAATPTLRAEGLTDAIGDIMITCTGGADVPFGTPVGTANIVVNVGIVPVTSRIIGSSSFSEAVLLIDDPQGLGTGPGEGLPQIVCSNGSAACAPGGYVAGQITGTQGTATEACTAVNGSGVCQGIYNVFAGQVLNTYQVVFNGIPVLAPATAGYSRTFRISNIRTDVGALGSPSLSSLATITAFISVSGTSPFALTSPSVQPGFVQTGLVASVISGDNPAGNIASLNYLQCNSVGSSSTPAAGTVLRFKENFATAFKTRVSELLPNGGTSIGLNPTPVQGIPGATYNSESDLVLNAGATNIANLTGDGWTAGLADYGTRLKAVFNNIPAGVSIYVTTTNMPTLNNLFVTTNPENFSALAPGNLTSLAYLVLSETAGDYGVGAQGFAPIVSPTVGSGNIFGTGLAVNLYQVPLTNGVGEAVWEVIQANPNTIDTFDFGVFYVYAANQAANSPAAGTYTVGQSFAPTATGAGLATTFSGGTTASSSLPIPRFLDTTALNTNNLLKIGLCQTTLLLPFLTNENGFETGVTVANTSTDTLGTTPQTGACAMTFYGDSPGPTTVTAPCTAAGACLGTVASGKIFAGTLTSILGSSFQGYAIITCNFQFAHGLTIVTDAHAVQLAYGYLDLIVNNGSMLNARGTTVTAEQLGN